MKKKYRNEKWEKLVVKARKRTFKTRFLISDYGRVMGNNEHILKLTSRDGYSTVNLKLYIPVKPETEEALYRLKEQVRETGKKNSQHKAALALMKQKEGRYRKRMQQLLKGQEQLKLFKKEYKKVLRAKQKQTVVSTSYYIHRLVAMHFLDTENTGGMQVIHKDYNKKNNYFKNLKWVMPDEALQHQLKSPHRIAEIKSRKKTRAHVLSNARLDETKVILIKRKLKEGKVTQANLAKNFGVSEMQISRIANGINWAGVSP